MKKFKVNFVAAMCGVMTLGSCAQEVINEEMMEPDSRLTVMTRAGEEGAQIVSPIRLYVFNNDDGCVATQTLESEATSFSLVLPAGSYDVYALGGVDDTRYVLPTKENATKTTAITLQSGQSYGDLMAGHSSVTLSSGNTNNLTLGLERKVMLIKSVTIKNVPTDAASVSISINSISESMLLDGTYQGSGQELNLSLTKQEDGTTWKTASENNYSLPSVGKPTISVTIGSTSYTYTCAEELAANHKITIEGTYKETETSTDVTLTGTITGATWGEDKTINFNFSSEGSETAENSGSEGGGSDSPANIPAVGDTYRGCYVLDVQGNNVTLLSPSQEYHIVEDADKTNQTTIASKISTKLATWEQSISTNWRLMTKDEAGIIRSSYTSINEKDTKEIGSKIGPTQQYFCIENGTIYEFQPNMATFPEGGRYATYLRPVTTITIQ